MTNALLLVAAGLFFVGGALILTRRSRREVTRADARDDERGGLEKHDDLVDLTRRSRSAETPSPPPPGGPEWMPPGRDPAASA